jgi:hypothetical protein
MPWIIDAVRIFTSNFDGSKKQIIARLEPFEGGTIHHIYGYEDPIYQVGGLIVGSDDLDTLNGYTEDGVTHGLIDYESVTYSGYVSKVSHKRLPTISQSFYVDSTHLATDPVYAVDVELLLDV